MKKTLIPIILFTCVSLHPCMNEYEEVFGVDKSSFQPDGYLDNTYVNSESLYQYISVNLYLLEKMDSLASDLAIAYIYLNRYERALEITTKLVRKYPAEYNVLINHAVCLELNGKYQEALEFMDKALKVNPDSHWGSEWIHKRVLEWVISGEDARNQSILGLDFGNDSIPKLTDSSIDVKSLFEQLEFQLEDRMYFTDSNDYIFGSLLYDYANLAFINGDIDRSLMYFEMCQNQYGYRHPALPIRIWYVRDYHKEYSKERQHKAEESYYNDYRDPLSMSTKNLFILMVSLGAILGAALFFLRLLIKKK